MPRSVGDCDEVPQALHLKVDGYGPSGTGNLGPQEKVSAVRYLWLR